MKRSLQKERGAVALFVVIFSALLITTITVAFVRIMVQNQQQATSIDLSKSALDSAFAGVEDAKRAIVAYRAHCLNSEGGLIDNDECNPLDRALNAYDCDTIQKSEIFNDAGLINEKEVLVKQNSGDESLNQAYTCVKVRMNTVDFIGDLTSNTNKFIPLKATGEFDRVVVQWYSQKNLQDAASGGSDSVINLSDDEVLPKKATSDSAKAVWPANRPPIMRFQLIQFGDDFTLSSFNDNDGAKSNNSTVFLMPSTFDEDPPNGVIELDNKPRRERGVDILRRVQCVQDFSTTSEELYACTATIELPEPIGPDDYEDRTAYLNIAQIYGVGSTYRICLQSCDPNATSVRFDSVQPMIDSTGRANDLFRRVQSRVELETSSVPLVQAAVDISGSLCKAFLVTDSEHIKGDCS